MSLDDRRAPAAAAPEQDPGAVRVTVSAGGESDLSPLVIGDRPDTGLTLNGEPLTSTFQRLDRDRGLLRADGRTHRVLLVDAGQGTATPHGARRREVVVDGWRTEVEVEPAARAALRERARRGREDAGRSGPTEVHAIIPGVVVSVSVAPGDEVQAGQQLLLVEAMKMQNELRAPRDGTIERVAVGSGSTIEVGDLLVVIA